MMLQLAHASNRCYSTGAHFHVIGFQIHQTYGTSGQFNVSGMMSFKFFFFICLTNTASDLHFLRCLGLQSRRSLHNTHASLPPPPPCPPPAHTRYALCAPRTPLPPPSSLFPSLPHLDSVSKNETMAERAAELERAAAPRKRTRWGDFMRGLTRP